MKHKETIQYGRYRPPDSKVFYNRDSNIAVVFSKDDEFVTVIKLNKGQPQYNNFIKNGYLQ